MTGSGNEMLFLDFGLIVRSSKLSEKLLLAVMEAGVGGRGKMMELRLLGDTDAEVPFSVRGRCELVGVVGEVIIDETLGVVFFGAEFILIGVRKTLAFS